MKTDACNRRMLFMSSANSTLFPPAISKLSSLMLPITVLLVGQMLAPSAVFAQGALPPTPEQIIERLTSPPSRGLTTSNRNLLAMPVPAPSKTTVSVPDSPAISAGPQSPAPVAQTKNGEGESNSVSIVLKPDAQSERPVAEEPPSIELDIQFDLNSASIRAESREVLSNLSKAMKSKLLLSRGFAIEGHSDSSGRADLNLRLSLARAESVKFSLLSQGIQSQSLRAIGLGSTKPLAVNNPQAAENRRVRIVTLP